MIFIIRPFSRGVAQPGSAPGLGPGGRRFESFLPDHIFHIPLIFFAFPYKIILSKMFSAGLVQNCVSYDIKNAR